jgi:enoyl-[acyl-carrier protein] reductase I
VGLFDGKKGLVLGVANKNSIAWAIAQGLMDEGAELGFTHIPDTDDRKRMEGRVRKLAEPAGAKLITPCDVQKDEDIARTFAQAKEVYGELDFVIHSVAFAPTDDIRCDTIDASREGFKVAMDISCYSLLAVAREAKKYLTPGGSLITLTYLGGEKAVPGYNMMGICKAALDAAVRYLAVDLGKDGFRINGISAGPIRTLSASAVGDFKSIFKIYEANAPLRRNVESEEVAKAAKFLLSDLSSGITGEILHVDAGYSIMGGPQSEAR